MSASIDNNTGGYVRSGLSMVLEVMQAYGMASRKFDEFIDAMSELGNVINKLNQLSF
ncbi:hypothetical protein NAK66_002463 [Klebsiella oxytoca]|nr:hypothetical protein [Klebsiella oxytoca]